MKMLRPTLILFVAALMSASSSFAQPKRVSPHETISQVIKGNRVTIVYGRPYSKEPITGDIRKIWGTLIPYGEVWRTGSDEATLLITQKAIMVGDIAVPAGAYTLWTIPKADGSAKLIINRQIGQWGKGRGIYDEANDVGRAKLQQESVDPRVDQFTMDISRDGILSLTWENTKYSVPITLSK
jgi:hypothetical protein